MKTIVFVGSSKSGSSYEAIKASAELLYYTVLLTNREAFLQERAEFPHVHSMIFCDISHIDEIRNAIDALIAAGSDIRAIVSFVEPYCYNAALLAREFGLKYFSAKAMSVMLDKIKTRELLAGTPYEPCYYEIMHDETLTEEMREDLPLVLKVPTSAGSKDVYRIETRRQYEEAYREIRRNYPDAPILAEKYLDGQQYLVETLTINHNVTIVAMMAQTITFTGRFIVTGYQMILDHEREFYRPLKEAVHSIIHKFGMIEGPCHLEIRHVGNAWKLIEANPRVSGGAINLFIETAYGVNLVKETLKFALGLKPDLEYQVQRETYLQYIVIPSAGTLLKITGKKKALSCPGAAHVYLRPKKGSVLLPPISMAHRYAYVIATGESGSEAKKNAKTAAAQIKFHLRALDEDALRQLSDGIKELLAVAEENGKYIDGIDALFRGAAVFEPGE